MLGVAYKKDIGDMRESPASQADRAAAQGRRRALLPRSARRRARGARARSVALEPAPYDAVVIVTDHSGDRLRRARRASAIWSSISQRDRRGRDGRRRRSGSCDRVGHAGLGDWGKNVVRDFDELAELTWLCDTDEERRARVRGALSRTRGSPTTFDELLADDELEAVVVATPVPTHYELARRALEAGKHVFVEKPPAMKGAEMEELVALAARARPRAHARGTCCSTTPALRS